LTWNLGTTQIYTYIVDEEHEGVHIYARSPKGHYRKQNSIT